MLANIALRSGADPAIGQVVMDEFHFYSEPDRGWAWQVPLLELGRTQFVLMSATLGDVTRFQSDLTRRTGRTTAVVTSAERPVPLSYSWADAAARDARGAAHDAPGAGLRRALHPGGRGAGAGAGAMSINVCTRAEKDEIASLIGGFRFSAGFGKTLSGWCGTGSGCTTPGCCRSTGGGRAARAGGLLKVICGTDTLGVGINVPIRTVVLTGLTKFDGSRQRLLKAREFHQIAGRAGRARYDTSGAVVVQAPEHVIENHRAAQGGRRPEEAAQGAAQEAARGFRDLDRGAVLPAGGGGAKPLVSRMRVSHSMLLNVLAREGDPVEALRALLRDNHEDPRRQARLSRRAIEIYRSLLAAGVVERLESPDADGRADGAHWSRTSSSGSR